MARDAFSAAESSFQGTNPVSLKGVMAFRFGPPEEDPGDPGDPGDPELVWVA